jgi:hypothetical protein
MERNLTDKTILIVQGSLLAGPDIEAAFSRSGARVHLTTNLINAFSLLRRVRFDGALTRTGSSQTPSEWAGAQQSAGARSGRGAPDRSAPGA